MANVLDYAPIAAAAFAVPQFVPQILKLRGTDDTVGVSWSWATLTSANNRRLVRLLRALGVLGGACAVLLRHTPGRHGCDDAARRRRARARPMVLISGWVALLIGGFAVAGRTGLGTMLAAAFIVQVTPSVWTAYRTDHPTGVSRGTWLLILGELSCWTIFGVHKSDPRLIILGFTGVTASVLMLARIRHTRRKRTIDNVRQAISDQTRDRLRRRARSGASWLRRTA